MKNIELSFNITTYEFIITNTRVQKCHLTNTTHISINIEILHEAIQEKVPVC